MKRANSNLACVGLKTKTGRAIAVVLSGLTEGPLLVKRSEILLVDPKVPGTSQPHHEVMDLPWHEGLKAVQPLVTKIENVAKRALGILVREVESGGCKVCAVGIAGPADRRLEKIGNPHIRAHAAEGLLFRRVLESAADANRLAKRVFVEKELEQLAIAELGLTAARLQGQLATLGHAAGPPWRADQRVAAIAAWLILAST